MKEKEELEVRMREELEGQLQVKEATLIEYLEDQRQNLLNVYVMFISRKLY